MSITPTIDLNYVDIDSYTVEQQSVIKAEFDNILVVEAKAGTGKTHTLIGFAAARPHSKILYLAYNSSIKEEAIQKFKHLKNNVTVKSTHGLAYGQFGVRYAKRFKEHGMEIPSLIYAEYCMDVDEENRYTYAYIISKLLKEFAYSKYTIDEYLESLIENRDLFEAQHQVKLNYFLSKLEFIWEDIIENDDLPFEHDFYLKLYQLDNPYLENYDYILLDEGQDSNSCVVDIVLQQTRTRKVFIGDTFQQIYSWRGAENSLAKMKEINGSMILGLTKSFRCSCEIADIALSYLKICDSEQKFIGNENIHDDDLKYRDFAVIARSNIQLFQYAAFETERKKLYFVGGFKSYKFYDLLDLVKLKYKKPHEEVAISNPFYASFDSIEELKAYAESTNETEILTKIKVSLSVPNLSKELFDLKSRVVANKKDADIILTTAHKSKGLEWDHVQLLKGFIDLSNYKTKFNTEEINLLYVAITRAKKRLDSDTVLCNTNTINLNVKGDIYKVQCPIDEEIKDALLSKYP